MSPKEGRVVLDLLTDIEAAIADLKGAEAMLDAAGARRPVSRRCGPGDG
jgi:hypothetical protein